MTEDKAPALFDLLLARGNVGIEFIRELHESTGRILQVVDQIDTEWQIPREMPDTIRRIADAIRKTYPEFANATDAEIIKQFGLEKS